MFVGSRRMRFNPTTMLILRAILEQGGSAAPRAMLNQAPWAHYSWHRARHGTSPSVGGQGTARSTYACFFRDLSPKIAVPTRSEEHTSELQSHLNLVCRLLLEKKKRTT